MTITIQNVSYRYPDHDILFSGITFTVSRGEAMAVIGPNGSGKTTLLRIVAGEIPPSSGQVDLGKISRVVMLPTSLDHFLLPWYSLQKNLTFFCGRQVTQQIMEPDAELILINEMFPGLIKTGLSRKVYKLSTGEKAIIGYVCAMKAAPELLILDELFGNLSDALVLTLIKEIRSRLNAGLSLVFTTHDNDVVKQIANRVISLA